MQDLPQTRNAVLGGRGTSWVMENVSVPTLGPMTSSSR